MCAQFIDVEELDADDAELVQSQVRRRILRVFDRRGLLQKEDRKEMEQGRTTAAGCSSHPWDSPPSLGASAKVRSRRIFSPWTPRYASRPTTLKAWNACCANAPARRNAFERLEEIDAQRLIYHLPKPGPDGKTQLILSPLELIERSAALVPPPRQHRHRYYGVLAPNSPLRLAVTALAPAPVATVPEPAVEAVGDDPQPDLGRSPALDSWAMLLARIYELIPLICPICGVEMRINAFVTEAVDVRAILEHIGEPAIPPRIARARSPPEWDEGKHQVNPVPHPPMRGLRQCNDAGRIH